jgi:HSP20 family protein
LFDLHHQMNRLFDDLFDRDRTGRVPFSGSSLAPALDLHADDKQIEITAELPGVKEQDIDLTIEDGVLTLTGEKKSEREEPSGYSERSYGRFERRITLPPDADDEHCTAAFRDGVLHVTFPRTQTKSRGRRIPLSGNGQRKQTAENDTQTETRQQAAEEAASASREGNQQS